MGGWENVGGRWLLELCGRLDGGDELVVGIEYFGFGVIREEIGDGSEVVFIGVGDEFVVAVLQHFGRESFREADGVGS